MDSSAFFSNVFLLIVFFVDPVLTSFLISRVSPLIFHYSRMTLFLWILIHAKARRREGIEEIEIDLFSLSYLRGFAPSREV